MLGGLLILYYAKKRKIKLLFENYTSFFQHLYSDCSASTTAYISWDCVRDKKSLCDHIQYKWRALQEKFFEQDEKIRKNQESNGEFVSETLVFLQYFKKLKTGKINQKTGKEIKNNEVCAREMQPLIY